LRFGAQKSSLDGGPERLLNMAQIQKSFSVRGRPAFFQKGAGLVQLGYSVCTLCDVQLQN
jgi:hypothetical protein